MKNTPSVLSSPQMFSACTFIRPQHHETYLNSYSQSTQFNNDHKNDGNRSQLGVCVS